jgi:NIMA (never in mitosis gene a)-related kinase
MSPEVCRNEVYNQKSDIWALGCALYEIVTLKKPFDHNNITDLIRIICEKEIDPLPDYLDPKLRLLIASMLQKDAAKRPSIWEILQVECVKERINKFAEEHNCRDSIENIVVLKPNRDKPTIVNQTTQPQISTIPMENLEEVTTILRQNIQLRTINTGLFSQAVNVVSGEDLFNAFKTHLKIDSLEAVTTACKSMLDEGLLFSLQESTMFHCTPKDFYRFQVDRPGIAANMQKIYKSQAPPFGQLTTELISKLNEVIKECIKEVGVEEFEVDLVKLKHSKAYVDFNKQICQLQTIQLFTISRNELTVGFINLHQIMHVHRYLLNKEKGPATEGLFSSIAYGITSVLSALHLINTPPREDFYYNIGQLEFSLDDIKNGILRGNKKSPNAYFFRCFSANDSRARILRLDDLRLVLLFLGDSWISRKIEAYQYRNFEERLDKMCKDFLSSSVIYDPNENELILPNVFKRYKADFGTQLGIINFILKYRKFTANPKDLERQIESGKFLLSYAD